MKAKPRLIRNFFVKEPKFSVLIALSSIILLLLLYFYTNLEDSFSWHERYQSHLAAQKNAEQPKTGCKVNQTIIIWQETYTLPTN